MSAHVPTVTDDAISNVELDLESFAAQSDGDAIAARGGLDERASAAPFERFAPMPALEMPSSNKALVILARLGGMMAELAAIRTGDRELSNKALVISVRLGGVIGKLAAIRGELIEGPPHTDLLQQLLLPLLAPPVTRAVSKPLAPFDEICPGVRIGFEANARVELTVAPKPDDSASPQDRRNVVQLSLKPPGAWLSIEMPLRQPQLREAQRYEFGLGARLDRTAGCRLFIRSHQQGGAYSDTPLGELRLHPDQHGYASAGEFAPPQSAAYARSAFIAVFHPEGPANDGGTALDIALDYINLRFA